MSSPVWKAGVGWSLNDAPALGFEAGPPAALSRTDAVDRRGRTQAVGRGRPL